MWFIVSKTNLSSSGLKVGVPEKCKSIFFKSFGNSSVSNGKAKIDKVQNLLVKKYQTLYTCNVNCELTYIV